MQDRRFTDDEFDIMVDEYINGRFDMLTHIIDVTVKKYVYQECFNSRVLSGASEDVYQDLVLKFYMKTGTYFLFKDVEPGQVNRDPSGFYSWMFTVAKNHILSAIDIAKRETGLSDDIPILPNYNTDEFSSSLAMCAKLIVESSNKPHIPLTWLALVVLILSLDCSKIKANHLIIDNFFELTLFELYEKVVSLSAAIPWLHRVFTDSTQLHESLKIKNSDGILVGDTKYSSYFNNDTKKSPASQLSDWTYRMNRLIERRISNGASN